MIGDVEHLLVAGNEALALGDWTAARDSFGAALEQEGSAEALSGLANASWWLGDVAQAVLYREQAFAEFRRRPDSVQAALTAVRLCVDYRANFGNHAASAGWLARATRLVDDHGLEPLRGWILLMQAYDGDNPVQGEKLAREAQQFAQETDDLDLELCALSQQGASLIGQGRISEGVALLDEAMAGSLGGESENPDTVVFTSCHMISSCSNCAEFERAVQWVRAVDQFTQRFGCPFLYTFCRTLYGGVLVQTGDWTQAEEELDAAVEMSRAALSGLHGQALATLAELRLAQGQIEEAEQWIAGLEDHPAAVPVRAAIHLTRGKPALAASIVLRRLDQVGENRLESAILSELAGEAEIALGETGMALDRAQRMADLGGDLNSAVISARGERLLAHATATGGDVHMAKTHLEAALAGFVRLDMVVEAARTRRLLAEILREDQPEVAVAEARAALRVFEDLGARTEADAVAGLLRELGVSPARVGPRGTGTLTRRELEVLGLLGLGLTNPEISERLYISRRTVEHHVARVLSKLHLRNRAEAAAYAVREGVARDV